MFVFKASHPVRVTLYIILDLFSPTKQKLYKDRIIKNNLHVDNMVIKYKMVIMFVFLALKLGDNPM